MKLSAAMPAGVIAVLLWCVLVAKVAAALAINRLPVERHVGRWTAPPARVPTAMMFDSPIVGNGDAGMTFGNPSHATKPQCNVTPKPCGSHPGVFYCPSNPAPGQCDRGHASSPSHTTFWISSNSFWSSNQNVDARPNYNSKPGGSESYTQLRIGDVQLTVPAFGNRRRGAAYSATQDLFRATINASYSVGSACTLSHESWIARSADDTAGDDNVLVTGVIASGGNCGIANISLNSGFLAGKFGPTHAAIEGVAGSSGTTLSVSRSSVSTIHNALTASNCFNAGQQADSQRWNIGTSETPSIALVDGRCIETVVVTSAGVNSSKIAIGQKADAACSWHLTKLKAILADEQLPSLLTTAPSSSVGVSPPTMPAGLVLMDASGSCAGLDANGEFVAKVNCATATRWLYDATSKHLFRSDSSNDWGSHAACLTAVEPNPLVVAALATRLIDSSGNPIVDSSSRSATDGLTSSWFTVDLDSPAFENGTVYLVTSIVTQGDCTGCRSKTNDPEAAATTLLNKHASSLSDLQEQHMKWWTDYWTHGAKVDLGPDWNQIEGFYYGMQYQIGSASRPNRFAPGLWGPWLTAEKCGWSGDYTLNYNFEANYYGVFSDNRPELVRPFFKTILNHVDLGRWRATMAKWGAGTSAATPGFWAQDFHSMDQLSKDRSGFVSANFSGMEMPTHLSPWKHFYFVSDWGQKNVGAFTTKAFMDYFDYTQNETFLATLLYPLTKLNGAFYGSYMTKIKGKYNVMHSCAMEGCGAQGPATSNNILVSNNPPFDLAFVKRIFRSLLEYSTILSVDLNMRTKWQDYVVNIADYPLTTDEYDETVFAQATLNERPTSVHTNGFPNSSSCVWVKNVSSPDTDSKYETEISGCGNARYPIVFFNAMHPGEDVDLASDESTLKIARRTIRQINAINDYSPTNGLCMAWPPSARVVQNATELLVHFDTALRHTMMPNFIPFINNRPSGGSGCNIENSGATVAINDLLASVHGHGSGAALRLFPGGWPGGKKVRFDDIRIRGAFTVSASATGRLPNSTDVNMLKPVGITSIAGKTLKFLYNWGDGAEQSTPKVTKGTNGTVVVATKVEGHGIWQFATQVGGFYTIS